MSAIVHRFHRKRIMPELYNKYNPLEIVEFRTGLPFLAWAAFST